MKPVYITEDSRMYVSRIGTFVFVMIMAMAIRYYMELSGSEVFIAVGAFGLLYSVYSYFWPKKLMRLDSDGTRMLSKHITVPWERISEITIEPYVEGEYIREGMRYIVCRGYSPMAEDKIEWWRLGVTARMAEKEAEKIRRLKKHYTGEEI